MKNLERLARGNPLVIIGAAALGGWLLGSGIFALPGISLAGILPAPHPTNPASSPTPATLPVSSGAAATLATSSASMSGDAVTADPFAGWSV